MKKASGLLVLVQFICGDAVAHVGDRVYPIYELTDQDFAAIDLDDGRTDDWSALVGAPTATYDDFEPGSGPLPIGRDDFDFRVWLAWHRSLGAHLRGGGDRR